MTSPTQENQVEQPKNDKELNFRALESKYQKALEQERQGRLEAERQRDEASQRKQQQQQDDDEDDEPYVVKKKLDKKLAQHTQSTQSEIQKAMEVAKRHAKEELKQEMWLENNPDFYDVMQNHAEKFANKAPRLAETILKMPEGFDRQKLVYQNIKELGLDKPEPKQSSVQEKIDANRRSPYYQPSGVGTAPYSTGGDYSPAGQKAAYDKLKELKSRLRV